MEEEKNKEGLLNNSLDKALKLLDYFDQGKSALGLSEISKLSGIPKATVYRMLTTFENNGYLDKIIHGEDKDKYKLGLKFLKMGKLVSEGLEIRQVALPFMEELRDKFQEDVQLIIPDRDEAVYIEKLESNRPVRVYTKVGRRAPLYGGACPRAILTFMEDSEINRIINSITLKKVTDATVIDKDVLLKMIDEDRKRGYTISYGELQPGTIAVGAPIFDQNNKVIASVSIVGPEDRFCGERLDELIKGIKDAAKNISRVLGSSK